MSIYVTGGAERDDEIESLRNENASLRQLLAAYIGDGWTTSVVNRLRSEAGLRSNDAAPQHLHGGGA